VPSKIVLVQEVNMSILVERRTAEERYRRQRNRLIIRTTLYAISIVPTILVALNFESFRQGAIRVLGGGEVARAVAPATTAKPVQPLEPSNPVPPKMPSDRPPADSMSARPDRRYLAPSTPDPPPLPPIRILSDDDRIVDKTRPTIYVLSLKLARKRQRCPVELRNPDSKLQVLPSDDFDMEFKIEPDDGTFDAQHPAVISFPTANPARIEVSIDEVVDGDKSAIINLDFLVESDSGRSVPLSSTNLQGICGRTESQGRKVQAALAAMEAEEIELESWVNSSVPVPYMTLKGGQTRIAQLNVAIPAAAQQVAVLTNRLQSVKELIELADSLDGSELKIAEIDAIE
jgi:hypothetical protein